MLNIETFIVHLSEAKFVVEVKVSKDLLHIMETYIYSYWEIFSQGKHDALLASGVAIYKKFEQIFLTLGIF